MNIEKNVKSVTVTLNEEELEFIRNLTQNSIVPYNEETTLEKDIRTAFFTMSSKALGYKD